MMMDDSMSGTTGFILGSLVTIAVAVLVTTGKPFWWPWLQRRWGKGQLNTLIAQLKRLNFILDIPLDGRSTRCASRLAERLERSSPRPG
jgi:hypothetical protein